MTRRSRSRVGFSSSSSLFMVVSHSSTSERFDTQRDSAAQFREQAVSEDAVVAFYCGMRLWVDRFCSLDQFVFCVVQHEVAKCNPPRRESTGLIGRCNRSTSAQAVRLSGRSRIKPIGILFSTRLPSDPRVVRKWSTHVSPGIRLSFFSQPRCRLCAIVSLLETAIRSDSRIFRGLRGSEIARSDTTGRHLEA